MVASLIILCTICVGNAEPHGGSVEPVYARADHSCGPRCLLALIRMTDKGGSEYTSLEDIYDLIGKKVNAPTTLYEFKVAAKKLGFTAEGYKCTVDHLKRLNGYAILHVRKSDATAVDTFHFILLKEVQGDTAMIVDPDTLRVKHIFVVDLEKIWNGYALVLSPKRETPLFSARTRRLKLADLESNERFNEIRDFGIVDSGSLLEHSFPICNKTDGPMTLRIVGKSCSCVSAELERTELGLGHESSLKVCLHVDKPGWSTATVAVEIKPIGVVKRYVVKAYGKDSFQTMPVTGYIEVPTGGVVKYPVRITYYTDSNDAVTFDRMESSMDGLTVGRVQSERTPKGEHVVFNFDLTLCLDGGKSTNTVRRVQEEVRFVLTSCRGERSIPFKLIAAIGQAKFRLTPENVFVIASKSAKATQKKIKVQFLTEPTPTNVVVKSDNITLPIEIKPIRVSKNTYLINLSFSSQQKLQNISSGMNKGEIVIVPEGIQNPTSITLPISVFIRE
jgi:predicted double-glycine peptidase